MSGNRNMADYTNFDGKTNKKIVQAPGGASSFSLAWSNQPTDYGPQKNYRRQSRQKNQDYQQRQPQRPAYNQPMRVMDEGQGSYGSKNLGSMNPQYDNRMGGERGYDNYNNKPQMNQPMMGGGYGLSDPRQGYGNYGNYRNSPPEQLDIAVEQQRGLRRPPSVPRQQNNLQHPPLQGKSSVRINGPPKQNQIFASDYNYWKDNSNSNEYQKKQNGSQKKIGQQAYSQKSIGPTGQKTSVRVNNPPGGKQSFTLG